MCLVGQSTSPSRFEARQGIYHIRLPLPVKSQAWSCPVLSHHESVRNLLKKGRLGRVRATMVSGELSKHTYDAGLHPQFTDREADRFAIGIVGDIHLEPAQMHLFDTARSQFCQALASASGCSRLIQLGDLGGYSHGPGGIKCFQVAKEFLDAFTIPAALVAGNHDLEGEEFETDEENLLAWQQAFHQRHYWSAQLGHAICLGLSTTRFRSNKDSVHEVHIDQEQIDWFRRQLQAANGHPVIVFTHAPPMGSGLKTVEGVHVRNRCAWLNHSSGSDEFIKLVHEHPNIRLWFSGHYHLSQNYANSISLRNNCHFAQVGVIGDCGRDGQHQSRILRGDAKGFKLSTLDHTTGSERLDLAEAWDASPTAQSQDAFWPACLPFQSSRGLASDREERADAAENGPEPEVELEEEWFGAGGRCILRRTGNLLIEYDATYKAAVGVVFTDIEQEQSLRLLDRDGAEVNSKKSKLESPSEDGSTAVEVQLVDSNGHISRRQTRNSEGTFFQIFQHNKWRAKQEKKLNLAALN